MQQKLLMAISNTEGFGLEWWLPTELECSYAEVRATRLGSVTMAKLQTKTKDYLSLTVGFPNIVSPIALLSYQWTSNSNQLSAITIDWSNEDSCYELRSCLLIVHDKTTPYKCRSTF